MRKVLLFGAILFTASCATPFPSSAGPRCRAKELRSIAIRVHRMDAMLSFYSRAFGIEFREVETFGLKSRFGNYDDVLLKFVPIRESVDFVGFPSHQLGFAVEDLDAVIELAEFYGGRQEGEVITAAGLRHAAVRDPDGNTLELCARWDG